jgi:hypothetical protein
MENLILKEANQLFLNGRLQECISTLLQIAPDNKDIKDIAARFEDNERLYRKGKRTVDNYDVTKALIRDEVQEFVSGFQSSIYKILFLASNPEQLNPLNYGKELDEITSILQRKNNKGLFDIKPKFAAGKLDLINIVNEYKPKLIYFSMHGTDENELEFTNAAGMPESLSLDELLEDLNYLSGNNDVKCIIFNTCKSDDQANAASEFIDYAIGMKQSIDDTASIVFARGFFEQFFNDSENIPKAFESGVLHLRQHENSGIKACADIPIIFKH